MSEIHVLVVDDESRMRKLVKDFLTKKKILQKAFLPVLPVFSTDIVH